MKHLLLLLAACSSAPVGPTNDPQAASEVAARLCTLFLKGKTPCEHEGTGASISGHQINVRATSELKKVGRQHILTLHYDFEIDGVNAPSLHSQITGDGLSQREAAQKGASDWAALFGSALADRLIDSGQGVVLQAIVDKQAPLPVSHYKEWRAYAGYLSIAGRSKSADPIKLSELLSQLAPELSDRPYHSLYLELSVSELGVSGHCKLDGRDAPALCARATGYRWPTPAPRYSLKQYVVFSPIKPLK